MGISYANIIIDISHEKVDRPFQYRIPEHLIGSIYVGCQVEIPFGMGDHIRKGYVVEITDKAEYDPSKLKEIKGVTQDGVSVQSQLICLAWWMKEQYGSTMNQALKTVLPVKQKMKAREKKTLRCLMDQEQLMEAYQLSEKKKHKARLRLYHAFFESRTIPMEVVLNQLNITQAMLTPLLEKKLVAIDSREISRNPVEQIPMSPSRVSLNTQQSEAVNLFVEEYREKKYGTYLLYGVTGSGKTEVYMEMMDHVLNTGRQVIVLIPEIALTYQTVMRFYKRFGDQVSIINSRLSKGERYDQWERARKKEISVMIGPRSALFTPFPDLGLVIIDEEHEGAYKSEVMPRYHARDIAIQRAKMNGASVVLGSATPSMEAYTEAQKGNYRLFTLTERAKAKSRMAQVDVIDLREELKNGNKSIFSHLLTELMEERLAKKEQIMLFMNRRGYANFVSCRSCGEAVKCPHCDVSLTLHNNGRLTCHYCGYTIGMPKQCPSCSSPYIAHFGVGTQRLEEMTAKQFPHARILRMDADTTSKKDSHQELLAAFSEGEADILIGTQMIVKGHDFPKVTLVGIMAADLSLYTPDFRCNERTFQLLTQAAGRAGRDELRGRVVIQTYNPEHYSIVTAANQDYEAFYRQEMFFRQAMKYPPSCFLLTVQVSSRQEEILSQSMEEISGAVNDGTLDHHVQVIGPVQATVYKINDIYRKILYIKHENYDILVGIKNQINQYLEGSSILPHILVQYDFS